MLNKKRANSKQIEINFEEWLSEVVDPVIKEIESLIPKELDDTQKHLKIYWEAFAQNSVNLCRLISNMPHHFNHIMMSFRLLQEISADIFYLKNHTDNIANLLEVDSKVKLLTASRGFTLRRMSEIINTTDIRDKDAIDNRKDGTQDRIDAANIFLENELSNELADQLRNINTLLNGYTHFNPAAIYLQHSLTDNGYFKVYMNILEFYPAWLNLVLVSLSEVLNIDKLNKEEREEIIVSLYTKLQASSEWLVDFTSKD